MVDTNQKIMIKNNKNFKPRTSFAGAQNQVREFKSNQDSVRISSLGGFGDVTQNMFVYEFIPNGDTSKSQIIIVDCGVGFPEEDIFGVDMQIPDTHYLEDKKETGLFWNKLISLLDYLVPEYTKEGKSYLSIGIGCTGGRHRSVMISEKIKEHFEEKGYRSIVEHRDIYMPHS